MATSRKKIEDEADFSQVASEVVQVELNNEVEDSFLPYAYYVIGERAIPDARDGMKPVQRRILYTMYRDGNTPEKQHTKSAKIVGQVMGILHPHGDSAIYEAMVRLAQPFTMMTPLIDPRGNFGDRPGAGAAASRYTEARMSNDAMLMVSELRERPVDFVPNYDQTTDQPTVLPVQYPYLTINGVSGIAVGFATTMAPHNPGEVLDATRWLLTHPNADLDKLMTFIPGPDFPTGCLVLGADGIREAYETGRGKATIRAPYKVEDMGRGKKALIFYEMPYEAQSEKIIEQIKKAIKEDRLQGIADVKDLTDRRNGIRLVIEAKAGFNVEALAINLYKVTDLETNFNFNNIALGVDGTPQLLPLKEQLQIFIDHRIEVVTRRTAFRKNKREERLHLLEGLLKALANIDEVIKIIRNSDSTDIARENLIKKFKIDTIQADYILDIPLRRLTKFDQIQLNEEKARLTDELKELDKILTDEKELRAVIAKELEVVRAQIDRPRRSQLIDGNLAEHMEAAKAIASTTSLEIEDEAIWVGVHIDGTLSRSNKEGTVNGKKTPLLSVAPARARGKIVLVTDRGTAYRVEALNVRDAGFTKGKDAAPLSADEKVIGVLPAGDEQQSAGVGVFLATRDGNVKITQPSWPVRSDEFAVISLNEGDELLAAKWVGESVEGAEVVIITTDTSLLKFPADKIRPQGLSGAGITGIKLPAGQTVLTANFLTAAEVPEAEVITYTGMSMKRTPYVAYPFKGRATSGVRSQKFLKGEETLKASGVFASPVIISSDGKKIDLPPVDPRRDGSGVKTIDEVAYIAQA